MVYEVIAYVNGMWGSSATYLTRAEAEAHVADSKLRFGYCDRSITIRERAA